MINKNFFRQNLYHTVVKWVIKQFDKLTLPDEVSYVILFLLQKNHLCYADIIVCLKL